MSSPEAAAVIDAFAARTSRADEIRGRLMRATIPAVILWAFLCLFLRHSVSRELFGTGFYIATAMALMIGLPLIAYGQFWLAVLRFIRGAGQQVSGRPSIEASVLESYRTRNPFQFALRWTALLLLSAFVLIGGILPETNPDLARELEPWTRFDIESILTLLGILYGLSMLWDWIAARRAAN